MARSKFHQYLIDNWPYPRANGASYVYGFGSDICMLMVTFHGSFYQVMVISDGYCFSPDDELLGLIGAREDGSIAEVSEAAEAFAKEILAREGKDPEIF